MDMEKLDPSPSYPLNKSQWEIGNEDGRRRKEVYRAEGRKKGKEGEEGKGGRNKGGEKGKGKGKRTIIIRVGKRTANLLFQSRHNIYTSKWLLETDSFTILKGNDILSKD